MSQSETESEGRALQHLSDQERSAPQSTPPIDATSNVRFNVRWTPYWDALSRTESLILCFTNAGDRIAHTEEAVPGILVDYTASEQIVDLDLHDISPLDIVFHLYDTDQVVGDKQPLNITWDYDPGSGDLLVYLTGEKVIGQLRHTEDPRVFVGVTDEGLWQAFVVKDAVQNIPAGASQAA